MFYRHFTAKWGGEEQTSRNWLKAHCCVGVKTNVITAVEVTEKEQHDSPMLAGLVKNTGRELQREAGRCGQGLRFASELPDDPMLNATPFVPFKSTNTGNSDSPLWNRLFHFFHMNRAEFLQQYHQRSNAESAFFQHQAQVLRLRPLQDGRRADERNPAESALPQHRLPDSRNARNRRGGGFPGLRSRN
jgi:hypothetical protein